jgi:murein DD-endopeptidase MepM/ murein hydrolase activator NlpD
MRGFKVSLITFSFFLLSGILVFGQEVSFDSLAVKAGFEKPLILAQLFYSGSEINENASVGNLLSQFAIPGEGKVISTFGFRSGRMHSGTDIKMLQGDTIYAAFSGKVTSSKYYHGYGNLIVIQHEYNLETYYGHLSRFLVKSGSEISKGEPIGLAGSTGRATTTHLHFEVRENNQPYDPELIFNFEERTIQSELRSVKLLAELNNNSSVLKYQNDRTLAKRYIVQQGDSLWTISRQVNATIATLCQLNNLSETEVLHIGQVLNIN